MSENEVLVQINQFIDVVELQKKDRDELKAAGVDISNLEVIIINIYHNYLNLK